MADTGIAALGTGWVRIGPQLLFRLYIQEFQFPLCLVFGLEAAGQAFAGITGQTLKPPVLQSDVGNGVQIGTVGQIQKLFLKCGKILIHNRPPNKTAALRKSSFPERRC